MADSQGFHVGRILIQDTSDAREELVRLGLFKIEACSPGNLPGDIHLGRAMDSPAWLLFQQRIQHRLELVLHPRSLEDAHCLVRAFMENGVAQHHPDLRRELPPDFLHHGVVCTAGLAGGIEEFNQCDGGIGGAEARGVVTDQEGLILGASRRCFSTKAPPAKAATPSAEAPRIRVRRFMCGVLSAG